MESSIKMILLSHEEFDHLADEVMEDLPREILDKLIALNTQIIIEDEAPPNVEPEKITLGCFRGWPPTDGIKHLLPNEIVLFQREIKQMCMNTEDICKCIRLVLLHEIGHALGLTHLEMKADLSLAEAG